MLRLTSMLFAAPAAATPTYEVTASTLLRFFGRVHPILVHFPVALILAAAAFELFWLFNRKRRLKAGDRRAVSPVAFSCLALGALMSVIAAGSGWVNADVEPHGSELALTISWHRWLGIAAASLAVIALLLALAARVTKDRAAAALFRLTLLAGAAIVSITGHLGGTLVYGDDYLTGAFLKRSAPADPPPPPSDPPLEPVPANFEADALAIFADRCVRCHGPTRQRGGLRLDSVEVALASQVIALGDPDASEVIRRVTLPFDDDSAMPPTGDRLTPEQVETLRSWIGSLARPESPPGGGDQSRPSPGR